MSEAETKEKTVLESGLTGTVKWFSIRHHYGFIAREDGKGDVFVHQSAISKSRMEKQYYRTLGEEEKVEFDLVQGEKGPEAASVTGPDGAEVKGSPFFRFQFLSFRRMLQRRREEKAKRDDKEDADENGEKEHDDNVKVGGDEPEKRRRRVFTRRYRKKTNDEDNKDEEKNAAKDEESKDVEEGDQKPKKRVSRKFRPRPRIAPGEQEELQVDAAEGTDKPEETCTMKETNEKAVLESGLKGTVKWFSVLGHYGFIARDDGKGDVFVHQSAIAKSRMEKQYYRTLGEDEKVEFDVVQGQKGPEAASVTGPDGTEVKGSPFFKFQFTGYRRMLQRRREEKAERDGEDSHEDGVKDKDGNEDAEGADPEKRRRRGSRRYRKKSNEANINNESGTHDEDSKDAEDGEQKSRKRSSKKFRPRPRRVAPGEQEESKVDTAEGTDNPEGEVEHKTRRGRNNNKRRSKNNNVEAETGTRSSDEVKEGKAAEELTEKLEELKV
uniref:CSD_1 domain-containing protein n=1 Tax=Steinernema glaseri TaxID=37863 RepID=A0A1I7ZT90_9BILA